MGIVCKAEGCKNEIPNRKGLWCGVCRNTRQRYGITGPEREVILESQSGKCKLCKQIVEFDGTARQYSGCIDHDHKTGRIRGILCGNCNTWVGFLENRNINLDELAAYLNSSITSP
jgi:hypothetical protein